MEFSQESPFGHFHRVVALHESPDMSWAEVAELSPLVPRGWYELSRVSPEDRIEFSRDFWLSKLSGVIEQESPLIERLVTFFAHLDEIGIFLSQVKASMPFEVHMVYTLKEGKGFFHGYPPATSDAVNNLVRQFAHIAFPKDYLAFLQVHDGFSKYVDTGVIRTRDMSRIYQRFLQIVSKEEIIDATGDVVNPMSLVPFYESFGLHNYQCFYADWFAEEEIGNVYFSEAEHWISNYLDSDRQDATLAFPTFIAWLLFYLEDVTG